LLHEISENFLALTIIACNTPINFIQTSVTAKMSAEYEDKRYFCEVARRHKTKGNSFLLFSSSVQTFLIFMVSIS